MVELKLNLLSSNDAASFDDYARILREVAEKLERSNGVTSATFPLFDINGNKIGNCTLRDK